MTIEERLDAISTHVQLVMQMQLDNEKRFQQIARNFEIVHDSIKRLENIALAHEHRLDEIQGE
jgi:hypothetical protein